MNIHSRGPRGRSCLVGVMLIVGAGLVVSGCETVGGGESGSKKGPFTDPNRPKERPKFKPYSKPSNCLSQQGPAGAPGVMLAYAAPSADLDLPAFRDWPQIPVGEAANPAPQSGVRVAGGGGDGRDPC